MLQWQTITYKINDIKSKVLKFKPIINANKSGCLLQILKDCDSLVKQFFFLSDFESSWNRNTTDSRAIEF